MNTAAKKDYGVSLTLGCSFDEALTRVKEAFKEEGFGVLTEMNVQQTLREKIGLLMEPYTILGMCNPRLASGAIEAEPNIGLLLPCNVLVARRGDQTAVSAQDPVLMLSLTNNAALNPIAHEARERIDRAMARLKA